MERYSNLSGTGVPLIKNTATSLLIRYKRQSTSLLYTIRCTLLIHKQERKTTGRYLVLVPGGSMTGISRKPVPKESMPKAATAPRVTESASEATRGIFSSIEALYMDS